jgi:hypothetical protein
VSKSCRVRGFAMIEGVTVRLGAVSEDVLSRTITDRDWEQTASSYCWNLLSLGTALAYIIPGHPPKKIFFDIRSRNYQWKLRQ